MATFLPIIATEFGYWSSENGSTTNEQTNVLAQTFNAFKFHTPYDAAGIANSNGFLMGTTWWCVFDWYQYKSNGYQTMGLISMDRLTEKPVAANLRSTYLPYAVKDGLIVSVEENPIEKLPIEFRLEQNYPNPFNPETVISYQLAVESYVTLNVYDLIGRKVAILVDTKQQAGKYNSQFSILNFQFSSGVYFYRLTTDKYSLTKKMLLIK